MVEQENTETTILETLEAIRKRPGMYVGGTDSVGLHHLLFWALDDILGNARAGRGTEVRVTLLVDGSCAIRDDALPLHIEDGDDLADLVGKATARFGEGAHVLGRGTAPEIQLRSYLPILRALSKELYIHVSHGFTRFSRVYLFDPNDNPQKHETLNRLDPSELQQTFFLTRFVPSRDIFDDDAQFDYDITRRRLREIAATHQGYRVILRDDRIDKEEDLTTRNGMVDILNESLTKEGENHIFGYTPSKAPFRLSVRESKMAFDLAIYWRWLDDDKDPLVFGWANSVRIREGAHVLGITDALRSLNVDEPPFYAAISVFLETPRFSSPIKDVLNNPEVRCFVADHTRLALKRYLESDIELAMELERCRARDRKPRKNPEPENADESGDEGL